MNLGRVWAFAALPDPEGDRQEEGPGARRRHDADRHPACRPPQIGGGSVLPPEDFPFIWVIGIFLVQGFFLPFTALLIAAGSMSEEYEQGTAGPAARSPSLGTSPSRASFIGGFMLITGGDTPERYAEHHLRRASRSGRRAPSPSSRRWFLPRSTLRSSSSRSPSCPASWSGARALSYIIASAIYFASSAIAGGCAPRHLHHHGERPIPAHQRVSPDDPRELPSAPGRTPRASRRAAQDILLLVGTPTETSVAFSVGLVHRGLRVRGDSDSPDLLQLGRHSERVA